MKLSKAAKKQFGEYMSSLRAKSGLTQREVAQLSGVSHSYVALMESGRRNSPSYRHLEQLAPVYRVSVEELAQKAGYKEKQHPALIPWERIEWAFECACKDPDFTYGMHVIPNLESWTTKAFVVELYQRATGRDLLMAKDETMVLSVINGVEPPNGSASTGDEGDEEGETDKIKADDSKTAVAIEAPLPIRKCRMPKPAEENKAAVVVKPAPTERKIRV